MGIRYALRVLLKSPAFTIVTLITLMLGIGANVAVFGVLNAVLLRPLEVRDPASLYQIRHQPWMSGRLLTTSYPAFEDFRERNVTFSGLAGIYGYSSGPLTWGNAMRKVAGDEVTGNYFDLLGVRPEAGRFFHAADEHGPGSAPYIVLSDALWRSAFQADPGVVGTVVELDRHPLTVVGVAPSEFHGMERFVWPDYWIPMVNMSDSLNNRTSITVTVIGRLKAGVTPRQATENLNAIAARLAREYPETDDGQPLRLIHPGLWGDEGDVIRGFLYGVTVLALLVLAAACANLATLFAARAADRSRELALRVALGASRGQLIGQLLTEAVLVSLMGGAAGLAGSDVFLSALNRWQPSFGGHVAVGMDARVFLAGVAFTLGSALLFGTIPAWQSSRPQSIKRVRRFALRDLLLGAQIAICTLLVTASLVAVRGMVRVLQAPLGFQPRGAMLADPGPAPGQETALIEAARSIPGVTAAGTVSQTPMTGGLHGIPVYRPGTTDFKLNNSVMAPYVFAMSPGYLDAAGTRQLGGRDVSWHDTAQTPYVAIVNENFAKNMWGHGQAIGQHFVVLGHVTEVVGVAEDGKYHDMQEAPHPVVYVPFSQSERHAGILVVRSPLPPKQVAEALLRVFDPNTRIDLHGWTDELAGELFPARAATAALGVMGLLAAMLAVTGLFGMAAYSVSRRMRELGIRVALGARRTQVIGAAVGRPMVLLGVGSVVGLLAGIFASRLLEQIVYQANPRDPAVVGGAVLTMALLGVAAAAIPATRALSVDPSRLMREE